MTLGEIFSMRWHWSLQKLTLDHFKSHNWCDRESSEYFLKCFYISNNISWCSFWLKVIKVTPKNMPSQFPMFQELSQKISFQNLIWSGSLVCRHFFTSLYHAGGVTIHVLGFHPATHINLTSTVSKLTGEYRGLAILRVVSSSPKCLRWRIMQFSFSQKKSEAFLIKKIKTQNNSKAKT